MIDFAVHISHSTLAKHMAKVDPALIDAVRRRAQIPDAKPMRW